MRGCIRGGYAPLRSAATAAFVATALLTAALPQSASAVRVVTYNILNFPGTTGTAREDDFRTVIEELDADVIVVQEMLSQSGVNQFLNNVLNYGAPGTFAAGPFVDGPDTDNALFYRTATIEFVSTQRLTTALRDINEYVVRPLGYTSAEAQFAIYSAHLKAGSTSTDLTKRLAEVTILRNHTNTFPTGSNFMLGADLNIRASTESAYQKLVGSEANNNGRFKDPLNAPGTWHDNSSFAWIHTQSPRTESFGGGATGGMDDRFDQLLISYALDDGEGLDYISSSYVAFGNDGQHFNVAINSGTNYVVSAAVADAIHEAADHIPVFADFQVPALSDAPAALDLGSAIEGALVSLPLTVENVASAPADELDYTLAAPAGFSAPTGPFALNAGESANHDVTMDTATPGQRSGTLVLTSDDVEQPTRNVSLSGEVLSHASPSLDGAVAVLSDTLDFGSHEVGEFTDLDLAVHNLGYSSLQALLDVHDADIVGGDGRFSVVGGFSGGTAGATPAEFSIAFDDAGATVDSLYTAVLTFQTRDDTSVAGWSALDDLVVHLSAFVQSGTSVPEDGNREFGLGLTSANPFRGRAAMTLTLPHPGRATVRVYDISGRVVATLVDDDLPAGEHEVVWNGRDSSGRQCASGVYLTTAHAGEERDGRKLVLVR